MVRRNPALDFLESAPHEGGKRLVEAYARFLLQRADIFAFPIDLEKLISQNQLTVAAGSLPGQRGLITIDLKILFNSSDPRTVQLYSQAHELIELLFLGLQEYDPPWLDDKSIQELLDQKEDMCESGAAELLMPMGWFRPLVESNGLSLQTGKGLARTSGLSLTAITRRMLETGMRECIFVIWKFAHKPTEFVPSQIGQLPLWGSETSMDPPMRPRVEYFWRSPTVNQYIKKDKSVGTDTSVAQTFDEPRGVIVRGYDYLEIGKEPGCYLTESISVAFDGQERVMSLVYLDDREEEQRRLDFIS